MENNQTRDTDYERNHLVRFRPPGFHRKSRVGEIFEIHRDSYHGTTYYVKDERGTRYQLGPNAILAPEETAQ